MTKTLTEQWREGTLEDGFYYILIDFFGKKEIKTEELFSGEFCTTPQEFIKEILDVVPPYVKLREIVRNSDNSVTKCHQLEKKLEIATKALIDYANSDEWELVDSKNVYWSRKRFPYPWRIAGKALKEMEGVK